MAQSTATELASYEIVCDTDDEQEWLSFRNTGIGASEIGAVIGLPGIGHRSSPLKVFCEKTGALEPDDLSDVEAVSWGHIMEPVIAEQYSRRTGRPAISGRRHRYQVLRSREHPWAICSLDYWTQDGPGDALRPLEIKNVSAYLAEDWLNGTPDYYVAQLQQQILITGGSKGTSACCLGGNRLLWCDMPRDENLIRQIIYHGSRMWQRILDRNAPDPDGSEATKETLRRLFRVDDGSTVVLPAVLEPIVYEWRDVKGQISSLQKREILLANQIKATMGTAQQGMFLTGDRVSWKSYEVQQYLVATHTKRPLLFHPTKE